MLDATGMYSQGKDIQQMSCINKTIQRKNTQYDRQFALLFSDVSVCAHASVSLHLLGMSSEPEVFSVHMNGQVLQQAGHKVSSVGLISGSSTTASMVSLHTGRWLLSSHIVKHMEGKSSTHHRSIVFTSVTTFIRNKRVSATAAGMHGFVDVKKCAGFDAPQRRMTIEQKRHSREWKYYIAAEEVVWDYAPEMHDYIDE